MTDSFGPRFRFSDRETLADGTKVFNVTVQHYAERLPPAEGEEVEPFAWEPTARRVGVVWNTHGLSWAAAPVFDGDDWSAIVMRAERSFPDGESAAMFLYGFDAALRWQRGQNALAKLPWRRSDAV